MGIKKKLTDQQRIQFAKQIEYMFEATQPSYRHVILLALLRGMAMGIGLLIGGTIVVGLLAWILGGLESIPLLGDLAETTRDTIQEGN